MLLRPDFCNLPTPSVFLQYARPLASMTNCCRLPLALSIAVMAVLPAAAQTDSGTVSSATPAAGTPPAQTAAAMPGTPATPITSGDVLTLEECVARAIQKNFDLKIQAFNTDNAKENLTIAKATFDPALNLRTQRSGSRDTSGSTVDSNGNVVTGSSSSRQFQSTSIGVSQRVATGATVSVDAALDKTKSAPARTLPNPAFDSDVSVTIRQPLLRGGGIAVTRAAIERARLGINIANLDFKAVVLGVIRNVENAYYNLAFGREQLAVRRFSLEVAQKLLDENRSRRATGVATDLDVLQAEVGVANAQRNMLLAEQTVKDREDALLAEIEPFGFNAPLGQVQLVEEAVPTINGDLSYKLARDNTPDLLAQQATIEQLRIDADVAKRNRLPTFDVGGSFGYNTTENSYRNAARRVWDGDGYSWVLDATVSLPLGLRAERARYRQSLSSLSREQMRLQQLDQDILVSVRAAVRSVQTNQESVRISGLATQLSQRQFDLEKARYDAGLSTFRRVQEAQEDVDTSRVNELQAKVTLRNALADLARLEGTSLQRYKITLE